MSETFLYMSMMFMMLYSIYWTIMSNSWLIIWICMEINSMTFIPMMLNKSFINNSMNSMIKYFIVQSFASSMFFIMILLMSSIMFHSDMKNISLLMIKSILLCSLLMKLGAAPFHWWFPMIMIKLSWMNCFILMTIQKIIPMMMIFQMNLMDNNIYNFSLLLSIMMGAIMGFNQTSIKMILSFSSINHIGWMMMNILISMNMLLLYFIIYIFTNMLICFMMNNNNINYINELFKNFNKNINKKIFMLTLMLSLGGLPPFIGFLPKLITIMLMINNNIILESLIMVISALITLKYYMNILIPNLNLMSMSIKWNMKKKEMNNFLFLMMFSNFIMSFIYMLLL